MPNDKITDGTPPEGSDVNVVTNVTGPDRYRIDVTASFECAPANAWKLLCDWEQFVAVGFPGMTSDFRWLVGGPNEVPSRFQFEVGGATLREEIYERSADRDEGRYRLRYRTLEPALGVLEYDAVIELERTAGAQTAFSATRDVRLAPGTGPEMLAGMIGSETQCLREHFAT